MCWTHWARGPKAAKAVLASKGFTAETRKQAGGQPKNQRGRGFCSALFICKEAADIPLPLCSFFRLLLLPESAAIRKIPVQAEHLPDSAKLGAFLHIFHPLNVRADPVRRSVKIAERLYGFFFEFGICHL